MKAVHNVKQILAESKQHLAPLFDTASLDAEVLVAKALGWRREQLYINSDAILDERQLESVRFFIQRRKSAEPVAYITGEQEFWSLSFKVNSHTLIPRPETEHLVESALQQIPRNEYLNVLDLGTGSGAIALSLASERPQSHFVAVDISAEALKVAATNLSDLKLQNVEFFQSDWFSVLNENFIQSFDVIVSNPPYIAKDDEHLNIGDVVSEPDSALVADENGLKDIRLIAEQARLFLKSGGHLMIEHGWQQAEDVRKIMADCNYKNINSVLDLAGIERLTHARHY